VGPFITKWRVLLLEPFPGPPLMLVRFQVDCTPNYNGRPRGLSCHEAALEASRRHRLVQRVRLVVEHTRTGFRLLLTAARATFFLAGSGTRAVSLYCSNSPRRGVSVRNALTGERGGRFSRA
jgi:hypothetical protein